MQKSPFSPEMNKNPGFKISRQWIIPFPGKVEVIDNITELTTKKQWRCILGLVYHYRDI